MKRPQSGRSWTMRPTSSQGSTAPFRSTAFEPVSMLLFVVLLETTLHAFAQNSWNERRRIALRMTGDRKVPECRISGRTSPSALPRRAGCQAHSPTPAYMAIDHRRWLLQFPLWDIQLDGLKLDPA